MDASDKKNTSNKLASWLGTGSVNIFGLPFAGKDTQSVLLARRLGAKVIAGGDILRGHHDQEKIKSLMSTGELFPTDYYFSIVLPFLSQPNLAGKPLVLSSVGRWRGEEETILKATTDSGHPTKAVVFLNLNENEIWQRFEVAEKQQDRGKRHDDDAHILEVRLKEFRDKTLPVIDYYRSKGLLTEVDGQGAPTEVCDKIIEKLLHFAEL
jgi:adenylate kinase